MLFEKTQSLMPRTVLAVPAISAQVAFYMPIRLWMVKEQPKLAVTDSAKIHLFVIAGVFFLVARLTD
jgi:hypothetical protein